MKKASVTLTEYIRLTRNLQQKRGHEIARKKREEHTNAD
jgi:hypothetical protein